MKKRVFPATFHCGFPEQFPLLWKPLSHLPREQKSCKSSCSIPCLPAASSSLALTNTESGDTKEVQEQLHKAAGVLKMLQGVPGGPLVRFLSVSGLQQMSAEGTALCKIFGGARKIRGRDSDQGAKLQNLRQIS